MKDVNQSKICQDLLEAAIDRQSPDSRLLQHAGNCPACQQSLATFELLRREGNAFGEESHPELKLKLIKKLAPLVAERATVTKPVTTGSILAPLWKLALAFTIVIIALATILQQPPSALPPNPATPQMAAMPQQHSFTIAVNGGETRQVSLDNPVALFGNESGEVTLPDHSRLFVQGPARLTLAPRGFHLIQGHVRAEVSRGSEEFAATTPHGIITVLGTVFVCETHARFTTVEVLSGKVRVSSDNAPEIILGPGEKSRMGQQTAGTTETGTIPSLERE